MLALWNAVPTVDRFFDDVMRSAFDGFGYATPYTPAVDIRHHDDEIVLSIDVPGVKRDDIEVALDNRVLTIKGSRKVETKKGENGEKAKEARTCGNFSVSYTLGEAVDGDRLSAELADGVLTIHVPKHAKVQPRRIEIRGSEPVNELAK
jgi:HSP20 family protein